MSPTRILDRLKGNSAHHGIPTTTSPVLNRIIQLPPSLHHPRRLSTPLTERPPHQHKQTSTKPCPQRSAARLTLLYSTIYPTYLLCSLLLSSTYHQNSFIPSNPYRLPLQLHPSPPLHRLTLTLHSWLAGRLAPSFCVPYRRLGHHIAGGGSMT